MKLPIGIAALSLAIITGTVSAQTMKPGLWEIATSMQGGSGEMASAMAEAQKQMESMPPEQRKMMQDMLAKQGVQMGASGGAGMRIKICMSQEMVDRNDVSAHQSNDPSDCTHTNSPRAGNTMKFSFVCTKPPTRGEGQVTFSGPEAYSMKMSTTATVHGSPEKMEMQNTGRWLGSDCGTIKPLVATKK